MILTEAAQKYEEEKQRRIIWAGYLLKKIDRLVYSYHKHRISCDSMFVEKKEPTAIMMNADDARLILEFEISQRINTHSYDGFWRFNGIPIYRCLDMVEGEIKVL